MLVTIQQQVRQVMAENTSGAANDIKPHQAQKIVLDYTEGDMVSHIKFGTGTVLKIVDNGKDYEVTVAILKRPA